MTTTIDRTILKINRELIGAFATIDSWFDTDIELLQHKVLEQLMFTNRHLLMLISEGAAEAKKLATHADLQQALIDQSFELPVTYEVCDLDMFRGLQPGQINLDKRSALHEIRTELRDQLYQCMCSLELLGNGEGVLLSMPFHADDPEKFNVYQHIWLLIMNMKRHLEQLQVQERL